jgi:TetR/AcrR family transcriptional regulator, mexCD-oprJ operon repressor
MSNPARRPTLRERVAGAILEAAAEVLASRGEQASMSDIASAAGVARATLYRYFPSRRALLDELARLAAHDAAAGLEAARLEAVAVDEALERAVRALVAVGDYFIVLARERVRPDPEQFEQGIAVPLRRLFERGQLGGEIRNDVPAAALTESLVGLVISMLLATPALAADDAVALISSLFLDGARARSAASR